MVFNCLENYAPQYLVDLCQSVSCVASRQHLRSASRGLLIVPRHRLSSYGRWAFSVAGRAIWTGYQTVWEIRPSAETPLSIHRRRFYFQLTRVHSALELSGWCALQIYLLTYFTGLPVSYWPGTGVSGRRLSAYFRRQHAPTPIDRHSDVCRPTFK